MAAILGVSANYHDAAAALVVDGQIVAAMQQERFSRLKNDPSLPLDAVHACLAVGGRVAEELDAVVFHENPYAKLERVLTALLRSWPRGLTTFPRALSSQLGGKLWVLDALARQLGVPRGRVRHVSHHEAHAASAFLCSPFEDAVVLTVDAVGEHIATAVWHGMGDEVRALSSHDFPQSLGLVYSAITGWLGFRVNEGEAKVMGLAGYGRPVDGRVARVLRVDDHGYEVDPTYFDVIGEASVGFSPRLESLLGPRRPPGMPWDFDRPTDQAYADVAATLQDAVERAVVGLARRARATTGARHLCMAGGVALNAVANARVAREAGYDAIWVQPAAGDAGGALGAALIGARDAGDPRSVLDQAGLGRPVNGAVAAELAGHLGLTVARLEHPPREAAHRLARGELVGFCQGRFEWGPRALGHRSLLAAPGPRSVRDHLNHTIKHREPFRPFAPAVRAADVDAWFGPHAEGPARFMVTTAEVRDREALSAVTHVDGTARLQVVDGAGPFAELIAEFGDHSGVPVVLNTSLNGRGEPIVASEADALGFVLSHDIDAMIIDDALITRS